MLSLATAAFPHLTKTTGNYIYAIYNLIGMIRIALVSVYEHRIFLSLAIFAM